jgi:hypothetical protein
MTTLLAGALATLVFCARETLVELATRSRPSINSRAPPWLPPVGLREVLRPSTDPTEEGGSLAKLS